MEYNQPSELIKALDFGDEAKLKVLAGVDKLARAVKSTLGASGKCVIYEDARGMPVITKDGVTVAESVVLYDPVENIGATLIKEAARNTVKEAGDGTTTATVLAQSLLHTVREVHLPVRTVKEGLKSGLVKVMDYLDKASVKIEGDMLKSVSSISCNNDEELGEIIAEAYSKVGKDGVVLMEGSPTHETYVEFVDGVQLEVGLKDQHFVTDVDKNRCVLEDPYVLLVSSQIPNVRKIQGILEHVIKNKRSLLIVAPVDQQVQSALLMNKVKGNIKVNIVDLPGFGPTKKDTLEDLAFLTGATVIDETLGDDLDLIEVGHLGEVELSVTDSKNTVLTLSKTPEELPTRIKNIKTKLKKEKNEFIAKYIKQRLAMLDGCVGIIKVGADSKVELKEKKDRVEDAIYATKAALQEGIVAGGGVALLNASQELFGNEAEEVLFNAIVAPFKVILENGGIPCPICGGDADEPGYGINVINGERINMIEAGIIDPVLVTKSALKNAVSVVSTIISADCVISNMRTDESNK
tara:strand:- start:233 stop:1801 length:1569 start_codon:yes stop_codon:yes gene_type:complete